MEPASFGGEPWTRRRACKFRGSAVSPASQVQVDFVIFVNNLPLETSDWRQIFKISCATQCKIPTIDGS